MKNMIELFNQQLKELPAEKERVTKQLLHSWCLSNEHFKKILDALSILHDETFEIDKRYTTISMKPLSHNFKYELCGIELGNELALNEYVQSVLDILNEFSPIIQFSISEYMIPHEKGRIFKIKCIF